MSEWLQLSLMLALAVVAPGPDFALVSDYCIRLSRRDGIRAAVGVGLGATAQMLACFLGLGIMLLHSPNVFLVIRTLGSIYLIFVGYKMLRTASGHAKNAKNDRRGPVLQGFLTNVTNPKAMFFSLSFVVSLVPPATHEMMKVVYACEIGVFCFLWFVVVAYTLGSQVFRPYLVQFQKTSGMILGLLIIGYALYCLLFSCFQICT